MDNRLCSFAGRPRSQLVVDNLEPVERSVKGKDLSPNLLADDHIVFLVSHLASECRRARIFRVEASCPGSPLRCFSTV